MTLIDLSEKIIEKTCGDKAKTHSLCYHLATAEILYHMPDHPRFLQSFVWQDLDIAPHFPVLRRFLEFWHHNLDGKLHSVTVASKALTSGHELRLADGEFTLH